MLPEAQLGQRSTTVASTNLPWSCCQQSNGSQRRHGVEYARRPHTVHTNVAEAVGTASVLCRAERDNEVAVRALSTTGTDTNTGAVPGSYESSC